MPLPAGRRVAGGGFVLDPSFQLNFADLGSGVVSLLAEKGGVSATYTRATAAATKLSTGLWKLDVASGSARSMYGGPTTTAANPYLQGYLPEGAATQLALNARDMTNASWTKGATVTVAQTGTGIDGGANSCTRITGGAVAATNTVLQTLAAAATSRTYSVWIQRVTGTGPVSITQDGAAYTDITAQLTTANFVRVELNGSILNASFGVKVDTNADVILCDCNQFEAGGFATTPIPAAGTRNADVLIYPTSSWFNATTGTFFSAGTNPQDGGAAITENVWQVDDTTTNERMGLRRAGNDVRENSYVVGGGVSQVALLGDNMVSGAVFKAAFAYAVNDFAQCLNSGTVGTDTSGTLPTVTQLEVGNAAGGVSQWSGPISSIRYFPQRLPDAVLQQLTSL